jgi:endo-1,4-beta-xylanase
MNKTLLIILTFNVALLAQPLAEGKDKFLGNVLDTQIYSNYNRYWNQVTPGNAGKWGHAEPSRDSYNWNRLDEIYNYAVNKNIQFKHHTLIWGNQQPSWINSLSVSEQREEIEEWISLAAARYPQVDQVDVVNEPLHAPPDYKSALGGDGDTGWDWIITSFELAREQYSDTTELLINEYNILHSSTATDNYIEIIQLLMDRDLIDGIGIQGHYFEFRSPEGASPSYQYSISTINYNLDRLADLGLPIYITEFDINEVNDDTQLESYQTYFPIFWEHPAVAGMTLWGYMEGDMWQVNAYILDWSGRPRPAMEWLESYIKAPIAPQIISPTISSDAPRNPVLLWHESKDATSYNVQLSRNILFSSIQLDTTVTDTMLQLDPLTPGSRYYWRVGAVNEYGTSNFSDHAVFIAGDDITDIITHTFTPDEYELFQNYPNPFNPSTTISFSLLERSDVRLVLINVLGIEVKTITSGSYGAGYHSVKLEMNDQPSGIYVYRLQTEHFTNSRKLLFMK